MRLSLRRLTTHWRLKLASLALALLLWVVVGAEQPTTQWMEVRVEPVLRDPDYLLTGPPDPATVRVRFSGPGRELWEMALQRPTLVLRVGSVGSARSFALDPGMVDLPDRFHNVQARDVRPAVVRLGLERLATAVLPVEPRLAPGASRGGLRADSLRAVPAAVRVSGPAPLVERLASLPTRPLLPPAEAGRFTLTTGFDTSGLSGLVFSTRQVRVSGRVLPVPERVYPDVLVEVPNGYVATPARVVVRLRGAGADDAPVPHVTASADSAALPGGGAEAALRLSGLPEGVDAVAVPARVRLAPLAPAAAGTTLPVARPTPPLARPAPPVSPAHSGAPPPTAPAPR